MSKICLFFFFLFLRFFFFLSLMISYITFKFCLILEYNEQRGSKKKTRSFSENKYQQPRMKDCTIFIVSARLAWFVSWVQIASNLHTTRSHCFSSFQPIDLKTKFYGNLWPNVNKKIMKTYWKVTRRGRHPKIGTSSVKYDSKFLRRSTNTNLTIILSIHVIL